MKLSPFLVFSYDFYPVFVSKGLPKNASFFIKPLNAGTKTALQSSFEDISGR